MASADCFSIVFGASVSMAMVLSVMTQQHVIVDDALHCHLSPSTCRCGALASRSCSPTLVPLLHPLLPCAHPFLVGYCISIDPSAAVRSQDKIFLFFFAFFLYRKQWEYIAPSHQSHAFPPSHLLARVSSSSSAGFHFIVLLFFRWCPLKATAPFLLPII